MPDNSFPLNTTPFVLLQPHNLPTLNRRINMKPELIKNYIDTFLEGLKAFNLSEESLQHIREHIKVSRVKSKETVILPGEICRHMHFIFKGGFVCRYVHPESGEAKTINFYLEDLHPFMACVD
ncbi:MAG: hypothetical protein AAF598_14405, partial [Bacteroidota bacterium]